jgi:hypothetical protein
MMTQLFAHLADDRDDGKPQYWDGGFRGHAWCDLRILSRVARSADSWLLGIA